MPAGTLIVNPGTAFNTIFDVAVTVMYSSGVFAMSRVRDDFTICSTGVPDGLPSDELIVPLPLPDGTLTVPL